VEEKASELGLSDRLRSERPRSEGFSATTHSDGPGLSGSLRVSDEMTDIFYY
jgi:hypothetical protein